MRTTRFLTLLAVCTLWSCGGDDNEGGNNEGRVDLEEAFFAATLPEEVAASQTLTSAGALPGRAAGVVPRDWGAVGGLQAAPFLIATSVNQNQSGQETQLSSVDVNGDGLNEDVIRVLVTATATYLAWEGATISAAGNDMVEAPLCHMLWEDGSGRYYARGACSSDAGMACRLSGDPTCIYSTARSNADCEITEGIAVCEEPVSVVIPDVVSDTGADAGNPDTTPTEDVGGTDTGGNVTFGECDPACLQLNETTTCCTGCGSECSSQFECQPVCPENTFWECELGCCFNADLLECADI